MKKRLFAILIVVALVFSSVAVLAACNGEEFTVQFKNMGRTLFKLETTNGKLDKAAVEKEQAKVMGQLKGRESAGYFFTGWFTTETADEDGEVTYSGEINYGKIYTANAVYVAGYEYAPVTGEEGGYTLVGIIGNVQDWGDSDGKNLTHPEWALEQDETEGWMYRIEGVQLLGSDSFKVKTTEAAWDEGKIKIGYDRVNDISLDAGVEEALLKEHALVDELFYGSDDGAGGENINVSQWVKSATVNVVLNIRTKKIDIVVTAIEVLDELPKTEWILVGGFEEDNWAASTQNEALIFTDNEDGTYTITYEFKDSTKWRIKTNIASWGDSLGYTNIDKITKTESVTDEVPADLFTAASDDNNIVVNYDCTLKLTITMATSKVDVEVQAITIPAPETVYWEDAGYVIVGGFPDANWVKPAQSGSNYLFTQDTNNKNIGTWTGDIPKDTSFKVATNIAAWTGRINIGFGASIVSVTNAQGQAVTGLFIKSGSDDICAAAKCNVTITLDVAAKTISIVVNSQDDVLLEVNRDPWGLIGTSAAGWDSDVELTCGENGHHTISGYQLKVGEFKVRKDKAWTVSCGSHNENIQVKSTKDGVSDSQARAYFNFNQDNIKVVTACTVDIDFVWYNASTWTLVITVTA